MYVLTNHSDEFVDNNFVGELTLHKEPFFLFKALDRQGESAFKGIWKKTKLLWPFLWPSDR